MAKPEAHKWEFKARFRRHAFSETIEEHNTAVKDLRDRAQREHGEPR